jgi:hypothetical protein
VWGWFDNCKPELLPQVDWLLEQPLSSSETFLSAIKVLPPPANEKASKKGKKARPKGNLLSLVPEEWPIVEQPNGEYRTKCPVCAQEGHDRSNSNLYIGDKGQVMFCHYGQGGEHTFMQILTAFRQLQNRA